MDNRIEGNYIGTQADGVSGGVGNGRWGINAVGSIADIQIGGLTSQFGNVISGNGSGRGEGGGILILGAWVYRSKAISLVWAPIAPPLSEILATASPLVLSTRGLEAALRISVTPSLRVTLLLSMKAWESKLPETCSQMETDFTQLHLLKRRSRYRSRTPRRYSQRFVRL